MEHAEAGSGLQDMPGTESHQTGTYEHSNGVRPEEIVASSSPGDIEVSKRQQPSQGKRKVENLAVCASPGEYQAKRKKTEGSDRESIGGMLRMAVVEHQLGLSLNLLLLAALTWLMFPSLRSRVAAFFWLQYPREKEPGSFGQGPRDQYLVVSFVVFFTGLRAATMDHLLLPLAASLGIRQKKAKVRFAEQAYLLIYYTVYWSLGVWIFVKDTPTLNANTATGWVHDLLLTLWKDWPRLAIGPAMKLYYLSQTAFWIQQIFVINIEERRKDHWQMFAHHIITVGLLVFSYGYRQLRTGNAILVLMDIVDLVFPLAKILRYLGWQTACDIAFGAFVVFWLLARHVGYLAICWSLYSDVNVNENAMIFGTYSTVDGSRVSPSGGESVLDHLLQPLLKPHIQTISFNPTIQWFFLTLLGALQLITIAWFVMICRVVARVLQGYGADDSRSDDEGGDEESENEAEDIDSYEPKNPASALPKTTPYTLRSTADSHQATAGAERFIEVPASSEDIKFTSRSSPSANAGRKRKGKGGISSGLNLGEHKEILNRIGCLSDEQLARERELRSEKEREGSPSLGNGATRSGRRK